MIPTAFNRLDPDALALYNEVRDMQSVAVTDANRDQTKVLEAEGLGGFRTDRSMTERFWPLQVHPGAALVWTGDTRYASLYAEVSLCDDPCACEQLVADHCGERIATVHGARLHRQAEGVFELSALGHEYCTGGSGFWPRTVSLSIGDTNLDAVWGHFTRMHGDLRHAAWWSREDIELSAKPCVDPRCIPAGPHRQLPRQAPPRPEFNGMLGRRVALTAVSIALVDDKGRRHLERGVEGNIPQSRSGSELEHRADTLWHRGRRRRPGMGLK